MNLIFKLFIIFGATSAFAQSPQSKAKENIFNFSRAEIVKDSKGEMLFKVMGENDTPIFFSADKGLKDLHELAKKACAYGPSSITASIGLFSVTWEKSNLCDEKK